MNIKCAHTDVVHLKDLTPYPFNENKHSEKQIEVLAKIIAKNGQRSPIVVSKRSGYITKGHGRLLALQLLGWESAAVDYQEYESELEEINDRVADNEIGRYAEFAEGEFLSNLQNLDVDLETIDFEEFGLLDFEMPEVEQLPPGDEDAVPELKEDPITKRGDVWILGNHRVMCGDSTMIDDVETLMNGEKADMVFTDPPYGVDYDGGSKKREKLKDDHIGTDIYSEVVPVLAAYCNGPCYVWYAGTKPNGLYNAVENVGDIHSLIIWVKNNSTFNMNIHYKQKHEPCLYWKPKGKTLKWGGNNKEDTVWEINRESRNDFHPTQKPVELSERAIGNHKADSVLDLFLGSGSTLIACEKTNRKCYGMELSESYCDIIIERFQNYSGKEAILEATGESYNSLKNPGDMPARCL